MDYLASMSNWGVSIIIPAYNAAETIAATLQSVLAQSCATWEAVVVDDGSSDSTVEVVLDHIGHDPRFKLLRRKHEGQSAARNAGIASAANDWLLFLDADDWIAENHLELMTQALKADSTLDAVLCETVRVTPDKKFFKQKLSTPAGDLFPILARRAAFTLHACIVRKELVSSVGGFDPTFKKSEDWDLWQRVARTGAQFGLVRHVLAFYRMRAGSGSLDAKQVFQDGLRVLEYGHAVDPRVLNPAPQHARGASAENLLKEKMYFLCWCAGLLIGNKQNPADLLELLAAKEEVPLDADAVGECLFEASLLPTFMAPEDARDFIVGSMPQFEEFLTALEEFTGSTGLRKEALKKIKRQVLLHSSEWSEVIQSDDEKLSTWMEIAEEREKWRLHWVEIAGKKDEELSVSQRAFEDERKHYEQRLNEKESDRLRAEAEAREERAYKEELKQRYSLLKKSIWVRLGLRLRALKLPAKTKQRSPSS